MKRLSPLTLLALLSSAACSATPDPAPTAHPIVSLAPESIEEEAGAEEEEFRKNAVNLFLGGATNQADDSGFAFGLDYEYKFNPHWGAGGFIEGATGDLRSFVGGLLAFYHPIEPLAIVAGPGLEHERGTEFGDAEWSAVLRIGSFYEFPISDDWVLSPAIYYDIAEGDNTFIYGINLGALL